MTVALARIEQVNFSSVKDVRAGVFECRIDFGPGYRIYLGKDGETLVILLAGGTKKRQQADITAAGALESLQTAEDAGAVRKTQEQ